ncbi:MAG: ATP-binding protein [Bacillota bacterium]
MQIRKAERKKAKLRLGIAAPSGAGKTYGALLLAFGMGGKVGLIDTEHGSGDLYAHLGDYDIISIEAPYTVQKYLQAIKAFEQAGYSTIIIDSLSHAWAGDGGLLDKQGKIADSGKANGFAAWRTITPEHNALVEAMLRSPCHIIATMRAKQEYVLETNDKGKQTPKKVGLAPVQRDGMEYEFTVMLDIDMNHVASTSKDRTGLFDGRFFKVSQEIGAELLSWLETGAEPPKVEEKALADHKAAIDAADSMEALQTAYAAAYRAAQAINDSHALAIFTDAKDTRKAQLTTKEAA